MELIKKAQLKKRLKKRLESIRVSKTKETESSVKQQIESDMNEIKDIGIIICAFENGKAPYDYIRTEPLFYFKAKNFDLMLHNKGTVILISIKESLVSNPISKINELKDYASEVENNKQVDNSITGKKIPVPGFLCRCVCSPYDSRDIS